MDKYKKCELCETEYDVDMNQDDCESIDETKRCIDCYDEFGDEWPDRV